MQLRIVAANEIRMWTGIAGSHGIRYRFASSAGGSDSSNGSGMQALAAEKGNGDIGH